MGSKVVSHLDPVALDRAAEILGNGGVVALPTETVYGLGASIDSPSGIRRVFAVKDRPLTHPLIVHGASHEVLDDVAVDVSASARRLAPQVWPGPVSILLLRSDRVSPVVTGGRDTVVVRVPAHSFFRDLVKKLGCPIAAPSANRFGRVSPTSAGHVQDDLGSDVDLIVDGGSSVVGVESTILDMTTDPPQILRHGGVPVEDLEPLVGCSIVEPRGSSRAPGMLASHYAPRCRIHTVETKDAALELLATFDPSTTGLLATPSEVSLFAAQLYDLLRSCDDKGWHHGVVVLPPPVGLGRAIRDRLSKASASPS